MIDQVKVQCPAEGLSIFWWSCISNQRVLTKDVPPPYENSSEYIQIKPSGPQFPSKCLLSIYWFGDVLLITFLQSQQSGCNLNNLALNPVHCCVDLVQAHWVLAVQQSCSNPFRLGVFCPAHTLSSSVLSIPTSLMEKEMTITWFTDNLSSWDDTFSLQLSVQVQQDLCWMQ